MPSANFFVVSFDQERILTFRQCIYIYIYTYREYGSVLRLISWKVPRRSFILPAQDGESYFKQNRSRTRRLIKGAIDIVCIRALLYTHALKGDCALIELANSIGMDVQRQRDRPRVCPDPPLRPVSHSSHPLLCQYLDVAAPDPSLPPPHNPPCRQL